MKLKVFTSNYPTGFGESYLNYEIPVLLQKFDQISINALSKKLEIQEEFSKFSDQIKVSYYNELKSSEHFSFNDKLIVIKCLLKEFIHCKQKLFFVSKLRRFYAMLKFAVLISKKIKDKGIDKNDLHYSFWMNEWALALTILKLKREINHFFFRVNGYDIYDNRHEGNYMPFRYLIYSQCTRVFAVSKSAAAYLKTLNVFPSKITHSYFGTPDFGIEEIPIRTELVVYSCSSVIDIKRVDKIAEVMRLLKMPVKWVHHGEGPSMYKVLEVLKKSDKKLSFVHSKNSENISEVKKSERQLGADIFINLSSTEGLPVTAIEAMSFGSTLVLNRVGSCEEIVNQTTGILVEPNDTAQLIADRITELFDKNIPSKNRAAIRQYWKDNFRDEVNYAKFADELKSIY